MWRNIGPSDGDSRNVFAHIFSLLGAVLFVTYYITMIYWN